MKKEILYGIHPLIEALKAGRRRFYKVYIEKDKLSERLNRVEKLANSLEIKITHVPRTHLYSITGTDYHQGTAAAVSRYPFFDLSEIIENTEPSGGRHFILLLDNILDPQNLGAIIRTALCAGINGIIIPKNRSATPTPVVSKASAGALEHALIARVSNMANTIQVLKKRGLWVYGADKTADNPVFSCDLSGDVAIVIGGEEKGIRPLVKRECDFLISIPQAIDFNPLNASAACAVVMYEAFRQRQQK